MNVPHSTDGTHAMVQLWDLIKEIKFAMLTTQSTGNTMESRPVTTLNRQNEDTDQSLWFFMSRNGGPVQELQAHPQVNVAYADPAVNSYVSVSGTAAVVDDLAKKEQLWTKMAQAWFPDGPVDSNLALVQVKIDHASYWDVTAGAMVRLATKMTNAVTDRNVPDLGEHRDVDFY